MSKALAPQSSHRRTPTSMADMMSDVVRRGTAARAMQLKRTDLAGKTGHDERRSRRIGSAASTHRSSAPPGSASIRNARSVAASRALPHGAADMDLLLGGEALQGHREQRRAPPPGLVTMRISAETGLAARPDDENAMFETFIEGHLPPASERA